VEEAAVRLTGIANPAYAGRVQRRLDIGRQRYGDADYLAKDCIVEVMEETPDIASYAVLELQRQLHLNRLPDEVYDEVYLDLVAAAAYGAVADHFAQRAGLKIYGMED
jgi:hypothetical protein